MFKQCYGEGITLNNNHTCDVFNCNDHIGTDSQNVTIADGYNHILDNNYSRAINGWSINKMLARLYDTSGRQSHLLWYNMSDDHSNLSDCSYDSKNIGDMRTVSLSLLNKSTFHNGRWVHIVYLQDPEMEVKGYYELVKDINESHCSLTGCGHLPEGYLKVLGTITCQILKIQHKDHQILTDINTNAKLAYDDYCQDLKTWQYYNCGYSTYMTQIIDQLAQNDAEHELKYDQANDHDTRDSDMVHSPVDQGSKTDSKVHIIPEPHGSKSKMDRSLVKDFNYPDKTMGYLAQGNTDFVFIGPDRQPIILDSVDTLLKIASMVRSTGQPNYKYARIPIKSGL